MSENAGEILLCRCRVLGYNNRWRPFG